MSDEKKEPKDELKFGALEVPVSTPTPIDRFTRRAAIQSWHFFADGDGLEGWRAKVREAGVPEDMTNINTIEEIIEKAMEVKPNAEDARDLEASYAWALVAFANKDAELRHFRALKEEYGQAASDAFPDIEEAILDRAVHLGRIIEWWRWREQGHDRRAVSRKASDDVFRLNREGGGTANAERSEMHRRWVAWARQLQDELLQEDPKRRPSTIRELILKMVETREQRADAVGGDCDHDPEQRGCFVCSGIKDKTLRNNKIGGRSA